MSRMSHCSTHPKTLILAPSTYAGLWMPYDAICHHFPCYPNAVANDVKCVLAAFVLRVVVCAVAAVFVC